MPTDIDILRKIDRIHPYPAKFPVDLAMNYISKYTNIGNTVYDPFVGSGTTLLASRALERNAYGTDVNHIAVLISQFKLLSLSQNDIKELWDFIARFENSFFDIVKTVPRFYYKSIDHWFCADAITVLSVIKSEISKLGKNEQKIFCNLVFSSIINTVSNQESDTRYAAIIKPNLNIQHIFDVFVLFSKYDRKIAAAAWLEFCKKRTPKDLISDSTRFLWQENNLKVKINRFGHAMDPDRGVLFFANMLLGSKKVTSEIQINRSASYNARGGYKSLFDSAPQENQMRKYVEHIINLQNNIMTEENALHIITSVWGLPLDLMEKTSDGNYFISNKKLYDLLIHHSSMSVKSIFFLSTALILSNQAREPICTIKWSD